MFAMVIFDCEIHIRLIRNVLMLEPVTVALFFNLATWISTLKNDKTNFRHSDETFANIIEGYGVATIGDLCY